MAIVEQETLKPDVEAKLVELGQKTAGKKAITLQAFVDYIDGSSPFKVKRAEARAHTQSQLAKHLAFNIAECIVKLERKDTGNEELPTKGETLWLPRMFLHKGKMGTIVRDTGMDMALDTDEMRQRLLATNGAGSMDNLRRIVTNDVSLKHVMAPLGDQEDAPEPVRPEIMMVHYALVKGEWPYAGEMIHAGFAGNGGLLTREELKL